MSPASPPFSFAPTKGRVYDLPCPVCKRSLPPILMANGGLPQVHFHSNRNRPDCRVIVFPPPARGQLPYVHQIPATVEARDYARRFVRE